MSGTIASEMVLNSWERGAYYLLLWICLIYTVLALALVWWCSSGRRRSLKHHDIEAA